MEKVKITREQADGIEKTRLIYNDVAIVDLKMTSGNDYGPIKSIDADTLIRALYIGYEVEETPEDKVKNYFKNIANSHSDDLYVSGYNLGSRNAVIETLNLLNIKIEGITVI